MIEMTETHYDSTRRGNMNKTGHSLLLHFWNAVNVGLITSLFAVCWYGYYAQRIAHPFFDRGNWMVVALYLLLYVIFAQIYEAYEVSLQKVSMLIYDQALAALMADGITFIVIWLLMLHFPNPLPGLATLAGQVVLAGAWSLIANKLYYGTTKAKKTMVVYDVRRGIEHLIQEYELDKRFSVRNVVYVEDCLLNLDALDGMDVVFLSGVHSRDRNIILKYCVANGIQVYVIPRVGDVIMSSAKKMHILHLPVLQVGRYDPSPEYLILKRLFDVVSSGIMLVILSPVMIITAIAIKAYDHGPVFYKQKRLTRDGEEFYVLKFRSMRVDAEANGVARLSTGENDPRITPVGRVCRKLRLDELPQLLNILGGSMSVVGPRPERPEIAAQYEEEMPEFRLRLQAKAGLTGYAQVYGKYNTTPYDKLQMDLMYIARPSIVEDLKIIFATIQILFMPESTEGVAEGQTTAMESVNRAGRPPEERESFV